MTKKHIIAGILSLGLVALLVSPLVVNGQINQITPNLTKTVSGSGLTKSDLIDVVNGIINILLGILGVIAVVLIIIAGFKWMTAGGNEESIKSAKDMIIQGIAGLAIIFLAYAITTFVLEKLADITS